MSEEKDIEIFRDLEGVLVYRVEGYNRAKSHTLAVSEKGFMGYMYQEDCGTIPVSYQSIEPIRQVHGGSILFPIAWRKKEQ